LNGHLQEGSRLEDLAFDPAGRLYVLTSKALVEVNPDTGVRISQVPLSGATSLESLVWDSERGTFLSAADRGTSKDVVTLDRSTGGAQFVSSLHSGFPDIEGLAFVPRDRIVPVAMEAIAAERMPEGVRLEWQGESDDVVYDVLRALEPEGPWTSVSRLQEPLSGRPGAWRFALIDAAAATGELAANKLYYRVGATDPAGAWSYVEFEVEALAGLPVLLRPNYPNPFNPTTTFEVRATERVPVDLRVYDVDGRVVHEQHAQLDAGVHTLVWTGRDLSGREVAAGVYPYVLRSGSRVLRGRAVLVK